MPCSFCVVSCPACPWRARGIPIVCLSGVCQGKNIPSTRGVLARLGHAGVGKAMAHAAQWAVTDGLTDVWIALGIRRHDDRQRLRNHEGDRSDTLSSGTMTHCLETRHTVRTPCCRTCAQTASPRQDSAAYWNIWELWAWGSVGTSSAVCPWRDCVGRTCVLTQGQAARSPRRRRRRGHSLTAPRSPPLCGRRGTA
jgi:hypothetical protein